VWRAGYWGLKIGPLEEGKRISQKRGKRGEKQNSKRELAGVLILDLRRGGLKGLLEGGDGSRGFGLPGLANLG